MGLKITTITRLPDFMWTVRSLLLCSCMLLFACGGGGGSSKRPPVNSQPINSQPMSLVSSSNFSSAINSSAVSSSVAAFLGLGGKVTYDSVPHHESNFGLNYSATTVKPLRGLVVELLDSNNVTLAVTNTDDLGNYSFSVEPAKLVRVRVKAQALRTQPPVWNFKVTDNTNANALYAMDGSLVAASEATAVRNLHAASGWDAIGYSQPRVAAPFAILDSVLVGAERVAAVDNTLSFSPLELRWSVNNKAAEGDLALGEIGTSFYGGSAIYILGDENNDTDEYDQHVILHEWGHYLEKEFSRSDSIGGDHVYGDKLDMRVAMSEGFANAFSAMMLNDPNYRDASGRQQAEGFLNDVSRKNHTVKGWYSEASVQSVLYNFYISNNGKVARDFTDIFKVINSVGYAANAAMISIYVFAEELRNVIPGQATNFNDLLFWQNIEITNALGEGESNSGEVIGNLPIYKVLSLNNDAINVCSTNQVGTYNKLGVAQFLVLEVTSSGMYQFNVQEVGDDSGNSDPDIYLYRNGNLIDYAEGTTVDQENLSRTLSVGTYVLELVDDRIKNIEGIDEITACFDVRVRVN